MQSLNNNAKFKLLLATWNLIGFLRWSVFPLKHWIPASLRMFMHPQHPGCISQSPGVLPRVLLGCPPHSWRSYRFLHEQCTQKLCGSPAFQTAPPLRRSVLSSVAALPGAIRPQRSADGHTATAKELWNTTRDFSSAFLLKLSTVVFNRQGKHQLKYLFSAKRVN